MKKKLLPLALVAFMTLGLAGSSFSQSTVVKINPLSLFIITGNLQVEHALNEKMSLQLGGFFGGVNLNLGADAASGGVSYQWFGITPEFRYYATNKTKDAPRGLYFAPFVRYRGVRLKWEADAFDPDTGTNIGVDVTSKINAIGGGVLLGYQFLFGDVFALDLFLGPQFSSANASVTATCDNCDGDETFSEDVGLGFGGVGVRAGIAIGIAF